MTQPSKVIGFLDVAGSWDPSLLCVMGAAVGVNLLFFRFILRRPRPLLDASFHVPRKTAIDGRLVLGAVIFGVGWGLAGYCPGPALVTLASGSRAALTFVVAMIAGMAIFAATERSKSAASSTVPVQSS